MLLPTRHQRICGSGRVGNVVNLIELEPTYVVSIDGVEVQLKFQVSPKKIEKFLLAKIVTNVLW